MEHGKKVEVKPTENFYVNMTWENANSNIEIEETEKQTWHHSFGDKNLNQNAIKKLHTKMYIKILIYNMFS